MHITKWAIPALLGAFLTSTGCVSLPPIVHVEHKGDQRAVLERLNSIEERLDRIEPRPEAELRRELRRLHAELEELRRDLQQQPPAPVD